LIINLINQPVHFLTYEHIGDWEISLGETDLYYVLEKDKLIMTSKFKADPKVALKDSITLYHKELLKVQLDVKGLLKEFIIEYLSNIGYGYPWYLGSKMFTKEEFSEMLDSAMKLIELRKEKASLNTSEITEVCVEYRLRPEPVNDDGTAWKANCPSGRGHWIHISSGQSLWYCGFCKMKGGIEELVEWIQEVKASKL
jgi:hypothetical protein